MSNAASNATASAVSAPRMAAPLEPPDVVATNLADSEPASPALFTLSSRGQRACQPISPYWKRFLAAEASPYSPTSPDGYVVLCVAENTLNFQAWSDKVSLCRTLPPDTGAYSDMHGIPTLRAELSRLMGRRLSGGRFTVPPDSICLSNGAGSAVATLALLLCEPGDAVLIPSPAYAAFANDLSVAASAQPVYVRTEPTAYRLDPAAFEAALVEFERDAEVNWEAHPLIDEGHFGGHRPDVVEDGLTVQQEDANARARYNKAFERMNRSKKRVRAVLLTNPHNPLGLVYEREEVEAVMRWAASHRLHVVVDEVYCNSIFAPLPPPQFGGGVQATADGTTSFVSALHAMWGGGEPPIGRQWLHVVQGLSKDFGLSGYRVAWVVTGNAAVVEAWGNVGYFTSVSNDVQSAVAQVLSDALWTDEYLFRHCELLLRQYRVVTDVLDGSHAAVEAVVDGSDDGSFAVPYVPAIAGMFVWVDLRGFMPASDVKGVNVWAKEEALFDALVDDARVVLTPGHAQGASEPGWFRLCYARVSEAALIAGLTRMRKLLYARRSAVK